MVYGNTEPKIYLVMYIIYKISFPNNKVYIGQTKNIDKRIREHLGEAKRGKDSKVYRAIRKYKISKENFSIIEENIETKEIADIREIFWIEYYNSFKGGYNSTKGGDVGNGGELRGENNPNSALSNDEVLNIRKMKSEMKYSKAEIYDLYKGKISISGFHKIWNYETYIDIGTTLNTQEAIDYYKHYRPIGSNNKHCIFTKHDILNIRHAYFVAIISSKELSQLYNCNSSTISKIISNKTYSDIPMPIPSFSFRRKNHLFEKEEIDIFINQFISSKLNIKDFWTLVSNDPKNLFGGYSQSQFRIFVNKELKNRNLKYLTNGKWDFKITTLS